MQEETHWSTCSHVPIVHVNSDFTERIWCVVSDGSEDLSEDLPSVWLWDVWVGLAPTLVLGMAPTHTMFGCQMTETVGANLSPVWMDALGWDL
jgi:hypothetical protein